MAEESSNCQSIDSLPGPFARAVVRAEELHEFLEIAAVGDNGVWRNVPLFLEMREKVLDGLLSFSHARATEAALTPFASIQSCISPSARSANFSRFCFLSRTFSGSSSSRPKFAFIGWKCAGSASRM